MSEREKILAALQKANAEGNAEKAQLYAGILQKLAGASETAPDDIGLGRSLLQGFGQGATFGFADEAGGALRAGLDMLQEQFLPEDQRGNQSFTERYKMFRDDQRGLIDSARTHHGGATMAAEFLPGLFQGGAGMAKSAGQSATRAGLSQAARVPLKQTALKSAAVGTGYGGVAGAGYSQGESAGEIASDAAAGAQFGGLLGGALPVAGAGIKRGAQNIGRRFGVGGEGVRDAAREAARRQLLKDLHRDRVSLEQAGRELAADPNMVVADLGTNTVKTAKSVARQPGQGRDDLLDFVNKRQEGAYDRIVPKLRAQVVDAPTTSDNIMVPDNFAKAERSMMSRGRKQARDLYDVAYQADFSPSPYMRSLLKGRVNKKGKIDILDKNMKRADREAREMLNLRIMKGEIAPDDPGMMARYWDEFQRSLAGIAKLRKVRGKDTAAKETVLSNIHKRLVSEMEGGMPPEWKQARKIWSGEKADQEAFEAGKKIFSEFADEVGLRLDNMSTSARDHYMIGSLRRIEHELARGSDTGDILRKLRGTTHGKQLMRTLFGGERGFRKFMRMADREKKYLKTFGEITRGSDTMENLAQGQEVGGAVGTLAGIMLGSNMGIAGVPLLSRFAGRKIGGALQGADELYRDELSKMLLSGGVDALTASGLRRSPVMSANMTGALGLAGATQAPGLLE